MSKKTVYSKNAPEPIGPYSQAVIAGDTLYVSGQIALYADTGELINENITEETHAVMKNLDAILAAAQFSFIDVVRCTIFITNMEDFTTINEAYGQYFKSRDRKSVV